MKKKFMLAVAAVLTATATTLSSCGGNSASDAIGFLKNTTEEIEKLTKEVEKLTEETEKRLDKTLGSDNSELTEAQEDSIKAHRKLFREACVNLRYAIYDLDEVI